MPYPKRLPRLFSASSLPCLFAAIGVAMSLAACQAALPHRIEPNAKAPADDPKNIARAMAQPKPIAPAPLPSKAVAAPPAAPSTAPTPARAVAASTPKPAAAPSTTVAAAPPITTTAEPAKAAPVPPTSTAAATSPNPEATAIRPPAASTPQAPTATTHSGVLAMMSADSAVLATRIGDQKTTGVSAGNGKPAPTTTAAKSSAAPPATAAATLKPAITPAQPAKTDTATPGKPATDSAASPVPVDRKSAAVAAAAAADNSATQAEPPQPPVVMVTSAEDIRIPPASAAAPPIPSSASVPAQGSVPAPVMPPATAKPEPPPAAAKKPPAETHRTAATAVSKPAAATAEAGGTPATPGDPNVLHGMPLPNLPSLQDQSGGAPPAATEVARADTPADAAPQPDQTTELAQLELKKAQNRISLSDAQLAKLQTAQDHLASGDSGGAFIMLQALNAELQSETRSYVVRDNESMWHVAGQQEVYGNSYLWPLLWQANRDKVKKPGQLYKGLRLSFPAHPTVEEVAQALAYSKANNLEGMNQADSQ